MSHQSEAILENSLIKQLLEMGYASAKIPDGNALVANLKSQIEILKKVIVKRASEHVLIK